MNSYIIPENIKYLLFDMDGTLVDTEPVGPATFLQQLSMYGAKPDEADYALFIKVWQRNGTDIKEDEFLASMVKKYHINRDASSYVAEYFKLYHNNILTAKPLPGIDAFLKVVSRRPQLKLAVVTASKLSQVTAVLDLHGWTEYFDAIVSEEDIKKHKPNPEPFITGIDKLQAASGETIAFEDSKNGTIAAKAAGCLVIGLKAGNQQTQDLSAADVVVNTFDDILLPA